jgi:hypothetical protein
LRELDQLTPGHQGVERGVLEGDADVAADLGRLAGHVESGHRRVAAGRPQEGHEHPHGRRLPGAVRAEEAVDLAGGDLDVDAGDGLQAALELALEPDRLYRRRHRRGSLLRPHRRNFPTAAATTGPVWC